MSPIWSVENCVTSTLSGSTPDSFRMTRKSVTFTLVRPTTPTRWPGKSPIALIFDLAPLRGAPFGGPLAHSTTTFLRRMATDSVPSGISSSVRVTARSDFFAASTAMLSMEPAVCTTESRTAAPSREKFWASPWINCRSLLFEGPTAIRRVVGRMTMKPAPTAAANNSRPAASTSSGEPLFLRPRGETSFAAVKPSELDMLPSHKEKSGPLDGTIARPCSNFPTEPSQFRRRFTATLMPVDSNSAGFVVRGDSRGNSHANSLSADEQRQCRSPITFRRR